MNDLRLFLPIIKADEAQRLVYGIAADETVDKDGESLDYTGSKPYFEAWTAEQEKISGGKSKGNVRIQHDLKREAGKVTDLVFDDNKRRVEVAVKVVDDGAWNKVMEGVLTGFSLGGSYVSRRLDGNVTKYVAAPVEISLVDSPCNPNSGFSVIKADGSAGEIAFRKAAARTKRVDGADLPESSFAYVGDPDKTDTWKLPIDFPGDEEKTKSHIRNALARFNQTEDIPSGERSSVHAKIVAAAHRHGIDTDAEKAVSAGDDRIAQLEKQIEHLTAILEKSSNPPIGEVHKVAKSIHEHLSKLKELHDEHHARVTAQIEKAIKAVGEPEDDAEQESEAQEAEAEGAAEKAVTRGEMQKAVKEAFETGVQTVLEALKGQRAPQKGIGDRSRVVKTVAVTQTENETVENGEALAKAWAAGDAAAGLKLMAGVKASAPPARVLQVMKGRR